MTQYELLDEKVQAPVLKEGDHIMINDMFYRVVNNFPVVGGGGRMLMLAFHTHLEPKGYKFHHADTLAPRFDVFRKIDQ